MGMKLCFQRKGIDSGLRVSGSVLRVLIESVSFIATAFNAEPRSCEVREGNAVCGYLCVPCIFAIQSAQHTSKASATTHYFALSAQVS